MSTAENATPQDTDPESRWGLTDEELATYPTVFADGLLEGQVAIVSGGGSGIGKGITFLLARLGAKVVICSRTEEKLAKTRDAIRTQLGREIDCFPMTIRDPEQVSALVEQVHERHGRIDILVNNGGGQFPQAALDYSVKGWNAVIDTNLNGTWYMMQQVARRWRDDGTKGSIVNIVANVQRGMPQVAHTCAARAGVIYLTKSVSTEWAPLGIRVNCVSPGAIESEGFRVYPPGVPERFADSNPMRRCGDVYDIAEAVVYLSARSGSFITGEVLTVDGGNNQWGDTWPGGIPDHFKLQYD